MRSILPRNRTNGTEQPATAAPTDGDAHDLRAQRDRLTERFAAMQSELGGLFYEMAIRDHVRMDVLIAKAAELQGVHTELSELERRLRDQPLETAAATVRGRAREPVALEGLNRFMVAGLL